MYTYLHIYFFYFLTKYFRYFFTIFCLFYILYLVLYLVFWCFYYNKIILIILTKVFLPTYEHIYCTNSCIYASKKHYSICTYKWAHLATSTIRSHDNAFVCNAFFPLLATKATHAHPKSSLSYMCVAAPRAPPCHLAYTYIHFMSIKSG